MIFGLFMDLVFGVGAMLVFVAVSFIYVVVSVVYYQVMDLWVNMSVAG